MKKNAVLGMLALLSLVSIQDGLAKDKATKQAASAVESSDADKTQVNDQSAADELRLLVADQKSAGVSITPELTNSLREQLMVRELFAGEAHKLDLDKSPELKTRVRMARQTLLAQTYQMKYLAQHAPTEAQVAAAYESVKQRAGDKEYHLKQVFVNSEDDAKKALQRLDDDEDFAKVAMALSKDQPSRDKGGDLGWLGSLVLQPAVITAISGLKKGEYTKTAIKVADGWHVIKVEDTRAFTLPTLEKLTPQIKQELSRNILQAHLAELRKNTAVR